ncbi:MAG TPA: DUF1275 family protein [Tepidisphaeraceae bacterium]|jgi:uncharacterized membrane protein YoaK (UPF0700 family)|nr:DUF1275 family protein [Tepidisphaeraceae bacterium]
MFSARAYSFRQKSRLAISLSWVGGYTNVVLYAFVGEFVSNMTGNVTALAKSTAEGTPRGIFAFGSMVLAFLFGAATSAVMTESARRRGSASKYVLPLAVEAILLTVVLLGIRRYYPITGAGVMPGLAIGWVAAIAMGLQNATITKISGAVVRTTHLTGVITDLGLEGIQYLLWFRDRLIGRGWPRAARMIRVSYRHPEFQRVALLATILGSFLFGALAGMLAFLHLPTLALAAPVVFLCWMIYVDWRTPIADVREIDLFGDHELKFHGIVKSLLPPELGIWRIFCKRGGKWHKPPDFEQWVDIMPHHWRVIVLSLSPLTRLDANSLLSLAAATRKLHDQHRRLVLAGVTPPQYRAIEHSEAGRLIESENLCPDLEFAIARGIELVRDGNEVAHPAA